MKHEAILTPMVQAERGLRLGSVLAGITLLLTVDAALLLAFLGVSPWLQTMVLGLSVPLFVFLRRAGDAVIPFRRIVFCMGLALVLVLLGGEGRIFYANPDWQVRDAVLADITHLPWPFAYEDAGTTTQVRAPIGMYLLPALFGRWLGGTTAILDWLLAAQNTAFLGAVFAMGSELLPDRRARLTGLVVILLFSGMDTLGAVLMNPAVLSPFDHHIENWAGIQFSSMLTLLFWVPQHAFIGWLGAVLFLLWRRGSLPLAAFLMPMPLTALWTPFGLAGTLPFAAFALFSEWRTGRFRIETIVLPCVSLSMAAPALAYLAAGSGRGDTGVALHAPGGTAYVAVELFEIVPWLALILVADVSRRDRPGHLIAGLFLLLCPFIWVGHNCDFMMRGSITSLAILAIAAAESFTGLSRRALGMRPWLLAVLMLGAFTPLREIARAIHYRPAPRPLCMLPSAFRQNYGQFGLGQYLVNSSDLPRLLKTERPTIVPVGRTSRCWARPWAIPAF